MSYKSPSMVSGVIIAYHFLSENISESHVPFMPSLETLLRHTLIFEGHWMLLCSLENSQLLLDFNIVDQSPSSNRTLKPPTMLTDGESPKMFDPSIKITNPTHTTRTQTVGSMLCLKYGAFN